MKKAKILAAIAAATALTVGGVLAGCAKDEHTHTYSKDWKNDATGHWHVADCGDLKEGDKEYKSGYAVHVWGDDNECDVCHYVKTPAQSGPENPGPENPGPENPGPEDPGDTAPTVAVTKGGTALTLVSAEIASGDTAKYKYTVEGNTLSLVEGDELTFLIDGKVPEKFGGNPSVNHGIEIESNVVTANDTGTYTFYLRYYEDNSQWEIEMTDGKTDVLYDGHYYLVGGISSWKCTAKYDLGATASPESPLTVTKKFAAGAEFKIASYSTTYDTESNGTPNWGTGVPNYGYSAVTAGLGYLQSGDNIIIKQEGLYTIEFDGTNVKISSETVEEPELPLDYAAKITFADGVKATIIFTLPSTWGLSAAELETGYIKIGEEEIAIQSSGSVTAEVAVDSTDVTTVICGFMQSGSKWISTATVTGTIEDGAKYSLGVPNWSSNGDGIKTGTSSWTKLG
ncbi:MAG: hypothetical protein K2N22_01415 [Clostridia bacterium]|nr:hypothetical protein [Clostridia bacterium]